MKRTIDFKADTCPAAYNDKTVVVDATENWVDIVSTDPHTGARSQTGTFSREAARDIANAILDGLKETEPKPLPGVLIVPDGELYGKAISLKEFKELLEKA